MKNLTPELKKELFPENAVMMAYRGHQEQKTMGPASLQRTSPDMAYFRKVGK